MAQKEEVFAVHWKELVNGEWERFSQKVHAYTPAQAATFISKKHIGCVILKVKKA